MRKISESYSLRKDAVDYGIKTIEEKMTEYAKKGLRECYVPFHYHPGPFKEFKAKYGDNEEYREFNVSKIPGKTIIGSIIDGFGRLFFAPAC